MIESFISWLVNIIETIGYPGVALSMFLESFFAPIPSEIILPFSGFVSSTGAFNIYITIIVATLAAYLGSLPFYFLGIWGEEWINKFLDKYGKYFFISKDNVEKAYGIFDKHGNKMVFAGRLIPIVRTLISFPAGIAKMPFVLFSVYTLAGTLIWSSLLGGAGYLLGDNWSVVSEYVSEYENVILVLGVLVVVVFVGYKIFLKIREKQVG
jgi:membrane protein DedA with SNARE-associated domain